MLHCPLEGALCNVSSQCSTGLDCDADLYVCRVPNPYPGVVLGTGTEGMACGDFETVEGDTNHYSCGPGLVCNYWGNPATVGATCAKAGSVPLGGPCTTDAYCQPGLVCPAGWCASPGCSATLNACIGGWICGDTNTCTCAPTAEVCDGKDNDCNGTVDDELPANQDCVLRLGPGHICSGGSCQCAPPYVFLDVTISSATAPRNNIVECTMVIADENNNVLVKDSPLATRLTSDSNGNPVLVAGCAAGLTREGIGTYAICSSHTSGSLTFRVDAKDDSGKVVQTGRSTQAVKAYPPTIPVSLTISAP